MLAIRQMSRYRAAMLHLAISALIATGTLALMLALWYPPPLFAAMGGTELALLIVGVDVAIGPLITLIIFDTRKKELLFDLAVVATLQMGALCYGIYAMHEGRPVYIAFVEKRFAVVAANELEAETLAAAPPEYRSLPQSGPRVVAVDIPADPAVQEMILLGGLAGMGAQHLPQYYVPYTERRDKAVQVSRSLDRLARLTTEETQAIDAAIEKTGRPRDRLRFLPMVTKQKILTAFIDGQTGDFLAAAAADPVKP